jgi:hypothetical protein
MARAAIRCGTAIIVCVLLAACRATSPLPRIHTAAAVDAPEKHCAWFGDERDGVLYFGESPFWWALRRAGGDPLADTALPGPLRIGRFELDAERFAPPIELQPGGARSGIWDVLAHPNGRLYFTSLFDPAGSYDLATGAVSRFEAAGSSLNELALGPGGSVLATRFGGPGGANGSVVVLGEDGAVLAEHVLAATEGVRAAAKSLASDPVRREIWVNTDLFGPGPEVRHDVRVLGPDGTERLRFARPEVQFMAFDAGGTGWFAELDGALLTLRIRTPEQAATPVLTGRRVPLDDAFPAELDFVQEVRPAPGGRAVVTRWSGRVHVVDRDGSVRSVDLPRLEPGGLYYTGVLADGRICATHCGELTVVCEDMP